MRTSVLLLALAACTPITAVDPALSVDGGAEKALLGGVDVADSSFNFQVAIFQNGAVACSGIILTEDWVLTDEACEAEVWDSVQVGVGSRDIDAMIRLPIDEFRQPGFVGPKLLHIVTGNLTDWGTVATLADLDSTQALATPGTMAAVAGWGPETAGGEPSATLQRADLPVLSSAVCASDDAICAGFIGFPAADTCGDYGAPLSVEHEGTRVVLGLNHSSDCAGIDTPASFVRTADHLSWIVDNVPDALVLEGVTTDTDDHGDDIDDATILIQQVDLSVDAELQEGDSDVFEFTVDSTQYVTLQTVSEIDTMGTLLDADGNVVSTNDDGGENFNFEIGANLEAGTYFIQVTGYAGTQSGPYSLSVEGQLMDVEECEVVEQTWDLEGTVEGAVYVGGEDVYTVTVPAGQTYRIRVEGDVSGTLDSASGWLDSTWTTEFLHGTAEGDSEVEVRVWTDRVICTDYTLTAETEFCSVEPDWLEPSEEHNPLTVQILDGHTTLTGMHTSTTDSDYYNVGVVQPGDRIEVRSHSTAVYLGMLDVGYSGASVSGESNGAYWTNTGDEPTEVVVTVDVNTDEADLCGADYDLTIDIFTPES